MSIVSRTRSADPALGVLCARKRARDEADVALVMAALDWALAHGPVDEGYVFGETGLGLGGPGCPEIGEFAVHEVALALGMSSDAGAVWLGKALELRHRLPRLWARVVALEVAVWKAFRVAERTLLLSPPGADYVDQHLAPVADVCSFAQIERTTDDALARFDPADAERRRAAAAERRRFDIGLDHAGTDGVVYVDGCLDLADALDLDQAIRDGARRLADLGSTEPLNVRRSMAAGDLARHQLTLDLDTSGPGRGVTIYAHLDGTDIATIDNTVAPALVAQVEQWCRNAGTHITIKPVIDLNTDLATDSYEPTGRLREQVLLRDRHCVFPRCTRRRVDLDHIVPFDAGGPTATSNLAALCRRHHRAKTFGGWRYTATRPGAYAWTSPAGLTYLVDRTTEP